ncbi:MAG: cupin domain-containing protein [Myxococcota bacterium]
MKLAKALGPLPVDELKRRYFGRRALVLSPNVGNPLAGLVTLEQIEARLNDGVASLSRVTAIGRDGHKLDAEAIYKRQPVNCWQNVFLRKARIKQLLEDGHSLVMHNMTQLNRELGELVADIEAAFVGHQADAHLYISPQARSSGYQAHKDTPQHKLYFQVMGTTQWTVFRGDHEKRALTPEEASAHLEVDFDASVTPGTVLYLPPGVFHRATNPEGPRVSVSIPFYPIEGSLPVDRTHIPLRALMNAS